MHLPDYVKSHFKPDSCPSEIEYGFASQAQTSQQLRHKPVTTVCCLLANRLFPLTDDSEPACWWTPLQKLRKTVCGGQSPQERDSHTRRTTYLPNCPHYRLLPSEVRIPARSHVGSRRKQRGTQAWMLGMINYLYALLSCREMRQREEKTHLYPWNGMLMRINRK